MAENLISSLAVSAVARLRKLLKGEVLAEGKPSVLLTRLRDLNDGNCNEAILRSVFLEQLPAQIRGILVATNVTSLQELAVIADQISKVMLLTVSRSWQQGPKRVQSRRRHMQKS